MIQVELTDAARDDLLRLREHLRARHGAPLTCEFAELEDDATLRAVQQAAISALVEIRDNPWAGAQNRVRVRSRHIGDGRRPSIVMATEDVTQATSASGSFTGSSPMRGRLRLQPFTPLPSGRTYAPTSSPKAVGRALISAGSAHAFPGLPAWGGERLGS